MISFASWKPKDLLVTSLRLDPHNPRIPSAGMDLSERDLIAELVEHDRVYELAKSIAETGYHPIEALIVVEENGQKYVVEGNRRLAALKLLLSPEAAPDRNSENRFQRLSHRSDPKLLRKVAVVVAPSRSAAAPVIMARHTQAQVADWKPLMRAKFFWNLALSGLTVDEIVEGYRVPSHEVASAVRTYTMYSIACRLPLPDEVARKVRDPRQFPITTLQRMYESPLVRQFLGIRFDDDKYLVGAISKEEFKKAYSKLVTDIAGKKVGSRQLNKTDQMEQYLDGFGDSAPDRRKRGSFTAQSLLAGEMPAVVRTRPRKALTPRKKRTATGIVPTGFSCDVKDQRVNDFCEELKKISVVTCPNAAALMFRTFLELSLGYYLRRTGHLRKLRELIRKKDKGQIRPNWHPSLRDMLNYVADSSTGIIDNALLLRAVDQFRSAQKTISLDSLNLYVHNPYVPPDETALRGFWTRLKDLFEILLAPGDERGS